MTWRDRPYSLPDDSRPEIRIRIRRPGTAVGWIIALNVAVFLIDAVSQHVAGSAFIRVFGLSLDGIGRLRIWQPATYMFLHAGVLHLLFNMLLVYVCGTEFERSFGSRRLVAFYAVCGVAGGLAYLGLSAVNPEFRHVPLVGASGAGFGLLIAAMVFFPHIQVILFIIPMPIRVFGLIMVGLVFVQLLRGRIDNPGGEVCHFAGAIAALGILRVWGYRPRVGVEVDRGWLPVAWRGWLRRDRQAGAWTRRQKQETQDNAAVDRILDKVREHGLPSLTRAEKRTLARATRRRQEEDRRLDRSARL